MPVDDLRLIPENQRVPLPQRGAWPEAVHLFEDRQRYAIWAAIAAGRPLLVRGEPGVGKSQLARAAAVFYGRLFVATVVHSRTEPQDLQWQFDAIARLGEAQALGATLSSASREAVREALDPLEFLSPGPLWWTFNYQTAEQQNNRCRHPMLPPDMADGTPENGTVLLIDEIDKAEADLPNGLLEVLANGGFAVPYGHPPVSHQGGPVPLVVITTNEERELPRAFVRRCLVLRLALPEQEQDFAAVLVERGKQHFPASIDEVRKAVARLVWAERERLGDDPNRPGQAEYLDILRALQAVEPDAPEAERQKAQLTRLDDIQEFGLKKSQVASDDDPDSDVRLASAN